MLRFGYESSGVISQAPRAELSRTGGGKDSAPFRHY